MIELVVLTDDGMARHVFASEEEAARQLANWKAEGFRHVWGPGMNAEDVDDLARRAHTFLEEVG